MSNEKFPATFHRGVSDEVNRCIVFPLQRYLTIRNCLKLKLNNSLAGGMGLFFLAVKASRGITGGVPVHHSHTEPNRYTAAMHHQYIYRRLYADNPIKMPTMYQVVKKWVHGDEPVSPETIIGLHKQIEAYKIVVYSKSSCPYCRATKNTLRKYNVAYEWIELDKVANGDRMQRGLEKITGQRTVPNIFINGHHVGGNSDFQELAREGALDQLVA